MSGLVDVFSAWFRTFGYTARADATLPGNSGSHHQLPLLLEQDARRVGVHAWLRTDPPNPGFFDAVRAVRNDTGIDQILVLSLAPIADAERAQLMRDHVYVWDQRRIAQELGEAVLAETCPDVVSRNDPLQTLRMGRVIDTILTQATTAPAAPTPPAPVNDPVAELPFLVEAPPALAAPDHHPVGQLELPIAFGALDQATAEPVPTPAPAPIAPAPPPAPAPTPAPAPAPTQPSAPAPARTGTPVLRAHVSKALALSMVKKKLKTVDRILLRLTPYHVFDYQAHLLVDGKLDAETRTGRMGVDAALKRLSDWSLPLETGEIAAEGVDIDQKKVRVDVATAEGALRQELVKLVTRDVVMAEDADEWSVVVKKKVALAPNDINLQHLGTFWLPVWRISGHDGSMEIDATSGAVIHEEILVEKADAQLI